MLKGIHPLLHADLLHALAAMGHGDELVIADANFPAASVGRRVLHAAGATAPAMLDAVLTVFPLDSYVKPAALTMAVVGDAEDRSGRGLACGQERRHKREADAEQHERPAAERVHPWADERLADDADRVVEAHDDADLDFRPAEARDVERQEDEAVHAEEEEEVGDRHPKERVVG